MAVAEEMTTIAVAVVAEMAAQVAKVENAFRKAHSIVLVNILELEVNLKPITTLKTEFFLEEAVAQVTKTMQ